MQQILFQNEELDLTKINRLINSPENANVEIAFQILRGQGYSIAAALGYILSKKFDRDEDEDEVWKAFEDTGDIYFVPDFFIDGIMISVKYNSDGSEVFLCIDETKICFFEWKINDTWSDKMSLRIKTALKNFIRENANQIEYVFKNVDYGKSI